MNEKSSFKNKSEKYNIAWFKLAEFVSRGEKERALGIYKLLTLSINDPALIYQLEGDILLAFNDENAIDKYLKAGQLYLDNLRFIEAVSIYEHLISLKPDSLKFNIQALEIYKQLDLNKKIIITLKNLITVSLTDGNTQQAVIFLNELEQIKTNIDLTNEYSNIIFSLIKNNESKEIIFCYIEKVLALYLQNNDNKISIFMNKIEILNSGLHQEIIEYFKIY